eukprot:3071783-Prymnesium_polylepis.2
MRRQQADSLEAARVRPEGADALPARRYYASDRHRARGMQDQATASARLLGTGAPHAQVRNEKVILRCCSMPRPFRTARASSDAGS